MKEWWQWFNLGRYEPTPEEKRILNDCGHRFLTYTGTGMAVAAVPMLLLFTGPLRSYRLQKHAILYGGTICGGLYGALRASTRCADEIAHSKNSKLGSQMRWVTGQFGYSQPREIPDVHKGEKVTGGSGSHSSSEQDSVNSVKQSVGVNSVKQSEGVNSVRQSEAVNSVKQSEAVNSVRQSEAVNSVRQSEAVNSVRQTEGVNSVKQSEGVNSVKKSEGVNSVKQSEAVNSVKAPEGVNSMKQTEGVNSVKQSDGVNTLKQSEGENRVESVSNEKPEGVNGIPQAK